MKMSYAAKKQMILRKVRMTKPNFARDLQTGKQGEIDFISLAATHKLILTQTDGMKGDLIDSDGNVFELKTDSYDHEKTENFFIELYSDVERAKPGGPTQALVNNCKFFVYYFPKNNIAYIFDTKDLCRQIDNYLSLEKPKLIEIQNRSWVTLGAKVKRSSLVPLQIMEAKK